MAASAQQDLEERFFTCSICICPFENPKSLPCLHTFCEDCIRDYTESRGFAAVGNFPCPQCRRETPIPSGGVESFPSNFQLQEIISHLKTVVQPKPVEPSRPSQATPPSTNYGSSGGLPLQRKLQLQSEDYPVPMSYNHKGAALVFGQYGGNLTDFTKPVSITSYNGQNVIISDQRCNRVMIFDLEGKIQTMFTCHGINHALCINENGNILIANSKAEKALAKCFTFKGHSVGSLGNQYTHEKAHGIAASKKNIAVSSLETDKVFLLELSGRLVREIGGTGSRKHQFRKPYYLAINTKDELIVSDYGNHAIKIFSPGTVKPRLVIGGVARSDPGWFNEPLGIDVDSSDNIFVCDSKNHRIQCFNSKGKLLYVAVENIYGNSPDDVPRDLTIVSPDTLAVLLQGKQFAEVRIYKHKRTSDEQCVCF